MTCWNSNTYLTLPFRDSRHGTLCNADCEKIRFCFPAIHSYLSLISLVQVVLQYTMELVLGFLIPYGISVASYICILRRIRQTKFRRRIRSEKLILAIVVTFCLFWLPYHVINMVQVRHTCCFYKLYVHIYTVYVYIILNIQSLKVFTMYTGLKCKEMLHC